LQIIITGYSCALLSVQIKSNPEHLDEISQFTGLHFGGLNTQTFKTRFPNMVILHIHCKKMSMLYLINKIVATDYMQYYLLN